MTRFLRTLDGKISRTSSELLDLSFEQMYNLTQMDHQKDLEMLCSKVLLMLKTGSVSYNLI